ncbi:MAG: PKD domain-containing protein [Planctomycetota bacterium]
MLWIWVGCVALVLDLFLNVSEFDAVRPRSTLYAGMRIAAHKLVGERLPGEFTVPLVNEMDPVHAVTFGRNQLDEQGWAEVHRIVERDGDPDPRIRAAVHETLAAAIKPRTPYRGGVEAIRLAAAIGDETTWDRFLAVIGHRYTMNRKLPLTADRDDLELLRVTIDAIHTKGTSRQHADLAQRIAAELETETDGATLTLLTEQAQRLLGDDGLYRGARKRLESALARAPKGNPYRVPDRRPHTGAGGAILVRFADDATGGAILDAAAAVDAEHLASFATLNIRRWHVAAPDQAVRTLNDSEFVRYAERDVGLATAGTPNDTRFGEQWHLHNTGQTGGTPDADIDAPEAWDIVTDSPAVIGFVDTGIDYNHEDLAGNIWINPGEDLDSNGIVDASDFNGMDDDLNGYVDDLRGWDFGDNDNDPMDADGHGTFTAGVAGAVGNNGIGVTGVAWNVKLMPLRVIFGLDNGGIQAIPALEYANSFGVEIVNHSWGARGPLQSLRDAYENSTALNAVSSGIDTDLKKIPSGYNLDNIIAIGMSSAQDAQRSHGDYVDLVAPSLVLLGTGLSNTYLTGSGSSLAAPQGAAAAALIWARFPALTMEQVKRRLIYGTDYIGDVSGNEAFTSTFVGGRLNLLNALEDDTVAPAAVSDLAVAQTSWASVTLSWTATGDDALSGQARAHEVRYSNAPITEANWDAAARVTGLAPSQASGATESLQVSDLEPGTYHLAVKMIDNVGNASAISNVVQATTLPGILVLNDDVEGGAGSWTATGLWHTSTRRANSASTAWYYGQESTGDYDTGAPNSGTLTSAAIDLTGTTAALLVYMDWSSVSNAQNKNFGSPPGDKDRMRVQASSDGSNWTTIFEIRGTDDPWTKRTVDLTPYVGGNVYVRFWFDTVDEFRNYYEGWYVDDIKVYTSGPALTVASDDFESGGFSGGSGWNTAWSAAGDASVRSNAGPHSGSYHVRMRKGNGTMSRSVDLTGRAGARLRFWSKVNSFESSDSASVRVSPDGSNWTVLRTFTSADTTYAEYDFDLSGFAMTGAFQVAFDGDMNANNDQWYIDDVSIVAVAPPASDPPVADAGPDQSGDEGGSISFDGSGSSDPDGTIVSYAWTFGDGNTASGASVNHTYADNGSYTVTLTVTDDTGGTDSDNALVTVANVAPLAGVGGPYPGDEGSAVAFSATVSDPGTADTHTYVWDFGDGANDTGKNVTHAYVDNGTYTVTVTVTDDDGASDADATTATIFNVAPSANAGGPYAGTSGTAINFTGSASDPGSADTHTFLWNFGDGSPSANGANVSHTYVADATYSVTLTVMDDDGGSDNDMTTATIGGQAGPVTFAIDDFESAGFDGGTGAWTGSWTTSGDVTMRTGADGPHSGNSHVRLRRGTGFMERTVDLAGATDVKLRFWAKLSSFENGDEAEVRVSPDGTNWTVVHTFVNGDDDNTYRAYEIDLGGFAMTAGFRIAFDANMNKANDRWFLDDIELLGTPGS